MAMELHYARSSITGIRPGGVVELQVQPGVKHEEAKQFLREWLKRGGKTDVEVSMRFYVPHRSLAQNRLHRALVRILTFEVTGSYSSDQCELVHEGMLEAFSERYDTWQQNPMVKESKIALRSHAMTTKQMSALIELDFDELASRCVGVEKASQITGYWIEWMRWRGRQAVDPITYESLKDYNARVHFCEACLKYLDVGEGQLAHIVSRGAGGDTRPSEDGEGERVWNRVKLCAEHHVWLDHQKGDEELLRQFPHLAWRWNRARERYGLPPVKVEGQKNWVEEINDEPDGE